MLQTTNNIEEYLNHLNTQPYGTKETIDLSQKEITFLREKGICVKPIPPHVLDVGKTRCIVTVPAAESIVKYLKYLKALPHGTKETMDLYRREIAYLRAEGICVKPIPPHVLDVGKTRCIVTAP